MKKSPPGLNRGLSSDLWSLRSPNHKKFTKEWVMYTEKQFLVKKSLQKNKT